MSQSLNQRIDDAINASQHLRQRSLQIHADQGRVRIEGEVASFFQKQMAQEALKRVEGVQAIDNHLTVAYS